MPLSPSTLASNILPMMSSPGYPSDPTMVAHSWSVAIDSYAQDAITATGNPVLETTPSIISGILSAMPPVPSGPLFFVLLDAALAAYWTAVVWAPLGPILGGIPPNPVPPGSLAPQLLQLIPSPTADAQTAANQMANAIHTWTTSMVMTISTTLPTGATAGPSPIS